MPDIIFVGQGDEIIKTQVWLPCKQASGSDRRTIWPGFYVAWTGGRGRVMGSIVHCLFINGNFANQNLRKIYN